MAAMAVTLDGLNINTTGTSTGYYVREGVDWGSKAISDIVNSGQYRLEEMDAVLAAGRVLRQVVIPLRIIGSSADDLDSKISAINIKLSAANRYSPISLVVTPQGSTATSTFKVVGGSLDDGSQWVKETDVRYRVTYNLVLYTLPFVYGAKQTLGSSGAPLLATTATPATFQITPNASALGDVLADVTIISFPVSAAIRTFVVCCVSGVTTWTSAIDFSTFTTGGGATFATVSAAKYKGGAGVGVTMSAANTPSSVLSRNMSTTDIPALTPFRLIAIVDDVSTTAADRGLNQIRARVALTQTQIGDWCACPPGAFSGASHFSQAVDLGTFLYPPEPLSSDIALGATGFMAIDMQTADATPTQMVFDELLIVPDLTSIIAEYPGNSSGVLTNHGTRVEQDMVFDQTTGASYNIAVTGAHIRARGNTLYSVYGSANVMASLGADMTYETMKAWAEYTPRWIGLAPA